MNGTVNTLTLIAALFTAIVVGALLAQSPSGFVGVLATFGTVAAILFVARIFTAVYEAGKRAR